MKQMFLLIPCIFRYSFELNRKKNVNKLADVVEKRVGFTSPVFMAKLKHLHLQVIGISQELHNLHEIFQEFCKKLKIKEDVAIEAIRGSCKILHNHFYEPHK